MTKETVREIKSLAEETRQSLPADTEVSALSEKIKKIEALSEKLLKE